MPKPLSISSITETSTALSVQRMRLFYSSSERWALGGEAVCETHTSSDRRALSRDKVDHERRRDIHYRDAHVANCEGSAPIK